MARTWPSESCSARCCAPEPRCALRCASARHQGESPLRAPVGTRQGSRFETTSRCPVSAWAVHHYSDQFSSHEFIIDTEPLGVIFRPKIFSNLRVDFCGNCLRLSILTSVLGLHFHAGNKSDYLSLLTTLLPAAFPVQGAIRSLRSGLHLWLLMPDSRNAESQSVNSVCKHPSPLEHILPPSGQGLCLPLV